MSEEAAGYSAEQALRGGRRAEIRAVRPDDRADLIAAVGRAGADSFHRRFFGARHGFTEREIASYLNIAFIGHVALVALVEEGGRSTIVGDGRYVAVGPGKAEVRSRSSTSTRGEAPGRRCCATSPPSPAAPGSGNWSPRSCRTTPRC